MRFRHRLARDLVVAVCALASHTVASALQISDVRSERAVFDPARGEVVAIKFRLDKPAFVEEQWFDGRDLLVRTIRTKNRLTAGEQSIEWNGRDEAGQLVPREAYRYTLRAAGEGDATALFDRSDSTGGDEITAVNVIWDPQTHRIRYRLPQAGRVNIRVGLQDHGPVLRTIVDWVARPAGDNEESWDGWDESHVLDLGHHPKLSVYVDAFALSLNTILVGPLAEQVGLIQSLPWGSHEREKQGPPQKKLMHYHSQQPIEQRGDVKIRIILPQGLPKDPAGVPVVSDRVTLRLDMDDPKDRERITQQRFEPVFFVDGTFAFENEVGYLPFSWIWDTSTVNEGLHYVSANVRGYEGNFGMQTIKVVVRRAAPGVGGIP